MNAIEFKPFAGTRQAILPDSAGIGPDLRTAILDASKASMELSDKLFVLETMLDAADEEGIS